MGKNKTSNKEPGGKKSGKTNTETSRTKVKRQLDFTEDQVKVVNERSSEQNAIFDEDNTHLRSR